MPHIDDCGVAHRSPRVPSEWATAGDRIALVFKCAAFALLPGVIAICVVVAQRPAQVVRRISRL